MAKGIGEIDKLNKGLGYAGAVLSATNLAYQYGLGDGISRKALFDAAVSIGLSVIAVSNPVGIVALGVYGLLDAAGAFDGIKEKFGIDDTIILKR